jgi:acyl-CoA reductase-like NAD-dependent aldehyde dehydrogenase
MLSSSGGNSRHSTNGASHEHEHHAPSEAPEPAARPAAATALPRAIHAARLAQPEWAARAFEDRVAALQRAARAMLEDRAAALAFVQAEMGKHEAEGVFTEALGPLDFIGQWRNVVRPALSRPVSLNPIAFPKKRARTVLVPRGVVGIIAPWNFPISGLYRSVFPALLTGNAIVVKPSEHTPKASAWFVEHLARELPAGVAQVVHGAGDVGAMLVESGIDACVFTGSVASGAKVRVRCAELGIPSSVEMGGKDAAIVLADCDLDRTVMGVTQWALSNSGQACAAIEVAYVDERIADAFVARLADAWKRLRTGPGEPDVDVHPVANEKQLAIIEAHVTSAIAEGAKLLSGGQRTGTGLGYPATLLDHCKPTMDVVREETFGPVLAIVRFRGVDEAVREINAGKYGLGASIWTRDIARAERLAERLDVGIVDVNNHAFTGGIPALPWSGTRATGYGIANSEWSLTTFCRPKAIVVDEADGPDFFWIPFDRDFMTLAHTLADAQIGKVLGAWKIPLLMRKRIARIKKFF